MASEPPFPAYKRNQVEWALWHLIDRGHVTAPEPPKIVVHQIKRLIDVDRQIGVASGAAEPWKRRHAFLRGAPQGTGGETPYRLTEVVALWIGLELLHMGLPQREIIDFLRALKPRLDANIREVADPYLDKIATVAGHRSGDMAAKLRRADFLDPAHHVYLVAEEVSASGVQATSRGPQGSAASNICAGRAQLLRFIEGYGARSKQFVVIEIANGILSLAYFLFMAPVRARGRASLAEGP